MQLFRAVLLVLLLASVACDVSGGAAPASPTASPSAGPISMRDAWGAATPKLIRGAVDDGHVLLASAVSPDAKWVLAQLWPAGPDSLEPRRVAVVEVATGAMTVLRTLPTSKHQAGFADSDDRYFVWEEEAQGAPWSIYAYDRETQRLFEVARRAPEAQQLDVSPHVDNGLVVWAQLRLPFDPAAPTWDLYGAKLPNGAVELITPDCREGLISWPYVACTRKVAGSPQRLEVRRENLVTKRRDGFSVDAEVAYAAVAGDTLMWIESNRRLMVVEDGTPREIASAPGNEFIEFANASPRFVGWFSNSYAAVYDRKLGRVVIVDPSFPHTGWNFIAKGHALMWTLPPSDAAAQKSYTPRDILVLDERTIRP